MGTLLTFEPPAPLLRAALRARLGVDVGRDAAERAIRAEIAYYRAHLHEGSDAAGLAALRRSSAAAMRPELPVDADGDVLTAALLDSLRFVAFPDAAGALRELRRRGLRLVVVSNWDVSLHHRLAETGLAELVDGAVASAEIGFAKPAREIFAAGLELAGVAAEAAWHAGDSLEADVEGAIAAGLGAVLVARDGAAAGVPAGVPVVGSLAALPDLWRPGRPGADRPNLSRE